MTDQLWFRRVAILGAAGLLVGLGASLAFRFAEETEEPTEPLAAFVRATPPPEENAAEWLVAGAAAVVWSDADTKAIGEGSLLPFAAWGPELERSVREALERQRGALETLHRAAPLERSSYGIDYSQGARARMPDMLSLIKACRLLLAEARVAAADGDERAALLALATMGRLASSLERESAILTALVGIACERMMLRAAAEAMMCGQPWSADPRFLDALKGTLSTEDLAAMMHRVFDAWALVETKALTDDAERSVDWSDAGVTASHVERGTAILHELVGTPFGTAPERFIETQVDTILDVALGNTRASIPRHQAALAQRQLVHAAIELRRIGLAEGSYPVDRSVVAELSEPDPFTGRPLLYEVREDGSAEVGLDGADELLAEVVVKSGAHVPPIELPAP